MRRGSCSTLSADSIWDDRGEEGLLTWGNNEFSPTIWDSATSSRAGVFVCVCVCEWEWERVSSCLSILLLSTLLPLCLSPCNKAEYLFLPLQLSGLLKGVRDQEDIRLYVCVRTCDSKCVCVYVWLHSASHAVLSARLITHPKRTVASSCVLTHGDWKLLILSRGDS